MLLISTGLKITFIVIASLLGAGLLFSICLTMYIAYRVFKGSLVRENKEKWGRCCSDSSVAYHLDMFNKGLVWGKENQEFKEDVHIVNDNLNLYGEFYDFGYKKSVIILPGRCESLLYSYYYAFPYKDSGYNVLVIDTRAHGNSDGKYNTVGIKEGLDLIKWMEFLHDKKGQESICLHCICVGGSTALNAYINKNCPKYVSKIIFDGLFYSFKETYANHMKDLGHGLFPVFYEVWIWFYLFNHVSVNKSYPYKQIGKVDIPVLFIFGKEDKFSLPYRSKQLINACKSKNKTVKWFEKGTHSHLRYYNTDEYDQTIKDFVTK